MDEIVYKVKSYVVEYFGFSAASEDRDRLARVMLFSDDVKGVAADLGFYAIQKLWMKQDHLMEPNADRPMLVAHMAIGEIGSVLDVLRHEKPIYVAWMKEWQQVALRTYLEPVGEHEKARK